MQTIHHASTEAATLKISFAIAGGWVWFWLTISMILFCYSVRFVYISSSTLLFVHKKDQLTNTIGKYVIILLLMQYNPEPSTSNIIE